MIPMHRLWLHGLYGPRCLLSPERPLNWITHSLTPVCRSDRLFACPSVYPSVNGIMSARSVSSTILARSILIFFSKIVNLNFWRFFFYFRLLDRVCTDVPQSLSSTVPLSTSPYVSQSQCSLTLYSPVPILSSPFFPHEVRPTFPSLCVSWSLYFPVPMFSSPFTPQPRYSQ